MLAPIRVRRMTNPQKRYVKIFAMLVLTGALAWLAFTDGPKAYLAMRSDEVAEIALKLAVNKPDMAPSEAADAIREFVNANSIHKIDKQFYAHWKKHDLILKKIISHYRGGTPPPHLECSSRTSLVEIMLRLLRYKTRIVVLFSPDKDFPSHTFLEFFNPDSNRWEIQDPDYNVYWVERSTGRRIGVTEILSHELDEIAPCIGKTCDWNVESDEGLKFLDKKAFLGLASIRDNSARERSFIYVRPFSEKRPLLVNLKRFPEDRLETYCQKMAKNCRQAIFRYDGPSPAE